MENRIRRTLNIIFCVILHSKAIHMLVLWSVNLFVTSRNETFSFVWKFVFMSLSICFLLNTSQLCFKNRENMSLHCKKKWWNNYFNYPLLIFSDFGPTKQKLQKMESLKQLFACGICKKSFNLAISLSEHVELHRSRKEPKNVQKMPRNQGNLLKGIVITK